MKDAIKIISSIVWNVHLKRTLVAVDDQPHLNFWRVIYGNFVDVAVIDWCKLFGSHNEESQPLHWKNVVPNDKHDEFREGLYDAVGVTEAEWLVYWQEIKNYRDKHAAHFDAEYLSPENNPQYPVFDWALDAVYYYYEWILDYLQVRGDLHAYPKDIRNYCERFQVQAEEAANRAIAATANMEETVQ